MDMSSSKADAVTITFGSLLLSPVETSGGCALPLSDQGLSVLLLQVCANGGDHLHLRVLGEYGLPLLFNCHGHVHAPAPSPPAPFGV